MLPDVIKGYIDARIIRSLGKGHASILGTSLALHRFNAADRCEKIKGNNVTLIIKVECYSHILWRLTSLFNLVCVLSYYIIACNHYLINYMMTIKI